MNIREHTSVHHTYPHLSHTQKCLYKRRRKHRRAVKVVVAVEVVTAVAVLVAMRVVVAMLSGLAAQRVSVGKAPPPRFGCRLRL